MHWRPIAAEGPSVIVARIASIVSFADLIIVKRHGMVADKK
jgi:hypothetical protein